jgi:hypothetical protein
MEKFQSYENWLRSEGYKSVKEYLGYMHTIDQTLMVREFENITSRAILKKLFIDLEGNRAFAARTKTDRDNILSGFRLYIRFIGEYAKK